MLYGIVPYTTQSGDDHRPKGRLATMSGHHAGNTQITRNGVNWVRRGANGGSASSMNVLGILLMSGQLGVTRDLAGSEHWLLRASKLGNADAQESVGILYLSGAVGGKPDIEAALHWLRASAMQGDATAQGILGATLVTGKFHVPRNPDQGVRWAEKAAAQHDYYGYYARGLAYRKQSLLTWPDAIHAVRSLFAQPIADLALNYFCRLGSGESPTGRDQRGRHIPTIRPTFRVIGPPAFGYSK